MDYEDVSMYYKNISKGNREIVGRYKKVEEHIEGVEDIHNVC